MRGLRKKKAGGASNPETFTNAQIMHMVELARAACRADNPPPPPTPPPPLPNHPEAKKFTLPDVLSGSQDDYRNWLFK